MKSLLILALVPALHAAELSLKVVQNTARELDELLLIGQQRQDVSPNPIADDPTFLRRTYLNIVGRIPSATEAQSFLDSTDEDKRTHLIESLVGSTGQQSRLFNFWADLLRLQTNNETAGLGWHVWLRNAVDNNMPYDQMVNQMLSADGHAASDPAAGYYLRDRGMLLDNVSNTVEIFLGHQIGCAQCHDHPFDSFTQMDYYQLAAFLGGTEYKFDGARDKIREIVGGGRTEMPNRKKLASMTPKERKKFLKKNQGKGMQKAKNEAKDIASLFRYHNRNSLLDNHGKSLKLPETYEYEDGSPGDTVTTRTIFGDKLENVPPEKRKQAFADWATSPENPFFTKVIANRLWAYVFEEGVVPALNDWSNASDPLYPELMDVLEKAMVAADYDVSQFLRILYHTQLFQREAATEEPSMGSPYHFSGPVLRRLSAEELRDSFVTLSSGVIDDNRNTSLEQAWTTYTDAYTALMEATPKQIRELDDIADNSEKLRREAQAQAAKFRTKAREAKEAGNNALAAKLIQKSREQQKKIGKKGMMQGDGLLAKVGPAISRRSPRPRSNIPEVKLRASEVPSPARGNTLAREFGASDRETSSASHTDATIPQSLRLLNGFETSILTSTKKNQFARDLQEISSPEERLEFIFLSLYSARPTTAEKEAFLPEVKDRESTATFARAILTSNRFLFVQ